MSVSSDAFSVEQCVTKRSRQLERLRFFLEATVLKYLRAMTPLLKADAVLLSVDAQSQLQRKYGELLLEFLQKERALQLPTLFARALHLERYGDELQLLLCLVEEEERLRQRVDGTWLFLAAKSMNEENARLIRDCERVWDGLLPQESSAQPVLISIRGTTVALLSVEIAAD